MFPLLLLLGEITPKTIAVGDPVGLSTRLVASPLTAWVRIAAPLRVLVRLVSERITNMIVGGRDGGAHLLGVDEFRSLLADVEQDGVMGVSERTLIENLIRTSEVEIREIMVPRPRVRFISADDPIDTVIDEFRRSHYDRVPVYRGHRDTIVGFLHSEDMVRLVRDRDDTAPVSIDDIVRPAVVVPKTKKIDEMFDLFNERNIRAALVVSEFGGVDGFISMTDIVAFVLSDLVDFAPDPAEFREVTPYCWDVSGLLKIKHFNAMTNAGLSDPQMTTVGGYVFRYLDRLPSSAEKVVIDGLCFEVLEVDEHLISRMRISPVAAQSPEDDGLAAEAAPPAAAERGNEVVTA
jgi:CBS domain containing-hemolysin-like protein